MFSQTVELAQRGVEQVKLGRVFSYGPLVSKAMMALVAIGSLVGFGALGREAFGISASRLLLLSDDPWPRRTRIELVGFDEQGERKLARGTDLIVRVRADANREYPPPEVCSIRYETADGDRGRVNMSRDGEVRDGYQYYVFNGKPFRSVLNDIRFDVIGGDYRLRDQLLKIVPSPIVTTVQLKSEFPAYTELLPREEPWSPGLQLPIGSRLTAIVQSSKPLVSATIRDVDTGEEDVLEFSASDPPTSFPWEIEELTGRIAVTIRLVDTDGIESLEPHYVSIGAVEDQIPQVEIVLRGISNFITPIARLPVEGSVRDDYQIDRSWYDLRMGDVKREFELTLSGDSLERCLSGLARRVRQ